MPAGLDFRLGRQHFERPPDKRVGGKAGDGELVRGVQPDPVGERDPLQHRRDLVAPVRPRRPDDQRQVQLRGGEQLGHASAAARRTNSSGSSSSARALGARPSCASAAAASSRPAMPASSSEFGSRLRRWAKAPSTTRLSLGQGTRGRSARRRKETRAESTFGGGRKTVRETAWKPVRSVASCSRTETAPYAFVLGAAKNRSATSRWTITVHTSMARKRSRLSTTIGVATL